MANDGYSKIDGNVASGSTDVGNPVKVGGKYNSTPPTLDDGDRGDLQVDVNGKLLVDKITDFATETTLATYLPNLDTSLSSIASEITLTAINTKLSDGNQTTKITRTQSNGDFIGSDIASIAASTEYVHGTDFTSNEIDISSVGADNVITIQMKATGANAGNNANVIFKFVRSLDGTNWDTIEYVSPLITMNGTAQIIMSVDLNIGGAKKIRLRAIKNEDASYAINNINCKFGLKI